MVSQATRPLAAAALLCAAAAPLAAQQPLAAPPPSDSAMPAVPALAVAAPVVVSGDTVYFVRTGLGAFTPRERADAIALRLTRLYDAAADGRMDSLVVVAGSVETEVRAGGAPLFVVTDADAAAEGRPRDELAAALAADVRIAVERAGRERGLRAHLIAAGSAVLITLALLLLFRLMRQGFGRLALAIEAGRGTRLAGLRVQRLELLSADQETDLLLGLARATRFVISAAALLLYLPAVFSLFPETRDTAGRIVRYVLGPLREVWDATLAYIPSLFYILVIVLVLRFALRLIRLFFEGVERGAVQLPGFYAEWSPTTYKIVRFLVVAFGIVLVLPYLPGYESDAFKGVTVFFGLLLSLGSTAAVANVVAGIVITYMRSFSVGDRVQIADTTGDVVERTLLVTRIRTIKNTEITIANSLILANHIVNYSAMARGGGLVLHTGVTIGYDVPWRQVHELLVNAAGRTAALASTPQPYVFQTALDDFYVRYELNAHTDDPHRMARTYSELHAHIQDAFAEAGVEIMSPHYRALRDGAAAALPTPARLTVETSPVPVGRVPE